MLDQHIRFVDKYFETLNAAESARYAGFSEDTSKQEGWRLLQRDDVQDYLDKLRAELAEKTGVSKQKVISEIARLAFSDIRKYYTGDDQLKAITDLDDDEAAALLSVKMLEEKIPGTDIVTGINKEIKLYDKLGALEKLARHLGLYEKDNAQSKQEAIITPAINVYNTAPNLTSSEKDIDV